MMDCFAYPVLFACPNKNNYETHSFSPQEQLPVKGRCPPLVVLLSKKCAEFGGVGLSLRFPIAD